MIIRNVYTKRKKMDCVARFNFMTAVLRNFHPNDLVCAFSAQSPHRAENDYSKYGTHTHTHTEGWLCHDNSHILQSITKTLPAFLLCILCFSVCFECVSDCFVKICHLVWCATRVPLYCFRFSISRPLFSLLYKPFLFKKKEESFSMVE